MQARFTKTKEIFDAEREWVAGTTHKTLPNKSKRRRKQGLPKPKKYPKQSGSRLLVQYIGLQVGCCHDMRKEVPGGFTR